MLPRLVVLIGILWAAGARALVPTGAFDDARGAVSYDCVLELHAEKHLTAAAAVTLLLDWQETGLCTRVTLAHAAATIEAVNKGRGTRYGKVAVPMTPGTPLQLIVQRRGTRLGVRVGEELLFSGEVPRPNGGQAGVTATGGWTVTSSTIQPLEPVAFADNFMRTADEPGDWTTQSGIWRLASAWDDDPRGKALRFANADTAQNPFAWQGAASTEARAPGFALCTAGQPAWEDYTCAAAIRPPTSGAVGLAVNLAGETLSSRKILAGETLSSRNPRRGLIVRWSPACDRGPRGNQLGLYALADDSLTPIKTVPGGYVPGQWARLAVVSRLGEVRVLVDGEERLVADGLTPWRGGVGLYAEGAAGATFDDVTVYGRGVNADLLYEEQQVAVGQRIKADAMAEGEWELRSDWRPQGGGDFFHRQEFFGDHRLSLTLAPGAGAGRLWLALDTDGRALTSGYRATIEPDGKGNTSYALYRDGVRLAQAIGLSMARGERYSVRFWREGGTLRLDIDGQTMVQAGIDKPVNGLRPAYHADGCFAAIDDPIVLGRNVLDYTFADAPVDWTGDGAWAATVRWACSPQWSFLGGWSRGDAALWHKKRFTGDQTFEAFIAPKMEFPRETHVYLEQHYRDLCVTICGDGQNPRTGYTAVCGAPDEKGNPTRRAVLLRNGVPVGARDDVFTGWPYTNTGHRSWYDVELRKRGNVVSMWVEGVQAVTFTDPQPIAGGVPAIWTTNNGIMVARARLLFANPPQPRTEPRVMLDTPWYPEWFNVGAPLQLAFPSLCSTGAGAVLRVRALAAPDGEALPAVAGNRLIFTPKVTGEHWYQVNGVDGELHSPSFHLFGPVFNPALGRDDAHALVLYRFTEGQGNVVRDRAPRATAADLAIPKGSVTAWLPGQGLSYRGGPALRAPGDKLAALATTRAATLELWLSTDSMYPPPFQVWTGNMLSWEAAVHAPNFALAHHSYTLFLAKPGGALSSEDATNYLIGPVFRTSLHHWVLTWDGATARCYRDGQLVDQRACDWNVARWELTAPLLLGNTTAAEHGYLGTYYLVAIHDRCLAPEQIQRHYQAGPSAPSTPEPSPKDGKGE